MEPTSQKLIFSKLCPCTSFMNECQTKVSAQRGTLYPRETRERCSGGDIIARIFEMYSLCLLLYSFKVRGRNLRLIVNVIQREKFENSQTPGAV